MKKALSALLLLTGLAGLVGGLWAETPPEDHAALIRVEGAIGPATSQYFERARQQALDDGAQLIIVQIDTPGGLAEAMRDMIKGILDTPVPVVGWVGPSGARAASAGTYLMYAAHVAAMAPGTNLGSATPVPVGGTMPVPKTPAGEAKDRLEDAAEDDEAGADETPDEAEDTANSGDAMTNKVLNDAIAYIRELAELRGRNADWAEDAVRTGANIGASEAVELKVIDLQAASVEALMQALDGREVTVDDEETVTLATAALPVIAIEPDWRDRLLSTLTNPTVAYLLMMAGIYGLLLEGYSPGAILPGTVGAICLLLALFAFQMLPVSYTGLALIALGLALMIGELFAPSFGVLGLGGLVAFVLGSIFLMDTDVPGYGLNLSLVAGIAIAMGGLLAATLYLLWGARKTRVSAGLSVSEGARVRVLESEGPQTWGMIDGERWQLRADVPLAPGSEARVLHCDGLTLTVEPISANKER